MFGKRTGLPERQVDLGLGALTQIFGPRISDDADDLERFVSAAGKLQARPDRVAVGVVALRQRRVDDGDPRRSGAVGVANAHPSAMVMPMTSK